MSVDLGRIIITIINFIILYFILRHFLFTPVSNTVTARENDILDTINRANADEEKAKAYKLENEENLKKSKEQGKTIVENYKVKAEKVAEDIEKEANKEAHLIMERAKIEAERAQEKAQDKIKSQAVDLAILMSSKALEKTIDENEHRRLIEDFIAKVGI